MSKMKTHKEFMEEIKEKTREIPLEEQTKVALQGKGEVKE